MIEYQEVNIDNIIQYWIEGYKIPQSKRLLSYDKFIDINKGKVILKLYITDKDA